ncbi:hypothetical protein COLO4_28485 [Corchorus olitorius]|uniref:Uncharacterized protein n=1 Tax=Corchorus olitorius TaxID=93759 RepID=A0A1R3HKG4_9ROSI|nr:hypothetical protein COLO4_28485 [Corchorus olitorius]
MAGLRPQGGIGAGGCCTLTCLNEYWTGMVGCTMEGLNDLRAWFGQRWNGLRTWAQSHKQLWLAGKKTYYIRCGQGIHNLTHMNEINVPDPHNQNQLIWVKQCGCANAPMAGIVA